MFKKTSGLMTIGGIMAAFGVALLAVPATVQTYWAVIVKDGLPHWCLVVFLIMMMSGGVLGALGTAIMGVAGKGADEHSTMAQTEAATAKSVADHIVTATEAKPGEMPAVPVVIVNPKEDK